ncbi:SusD/RagB family nutrient-binding outer membrane lipoprotein [Chitinophaga horti]|uniref:SusD/RagB family nutrient-binding outer membrane lipoprotein n=1 Tax=Chitinophaga horti TaxID=2920382 RepID=A0ABY6J094_9BACT|nr:SusD/RagB family nutrient-binding outer membrane lipoprotein [Chitinophaga horti]UYQ93066.1 SusD/RagB family nutrient-binding outer membrane lipoprotein [Chitinophaga horti]
MKVLSIKNILLGLAVTAVALPGCKKFLDVNDNPNDLKNADISLVLPSAEAAIAHVVGNNFQVYGGIWAQYWTQFWLSSQYKTIDQYQPVASDFDRGWGILYNDALTDLNYIISQPATAKNNQYRAIAFILRAYTFQLLTDAFGDIPLKDATKGQSGNLSPAYDPQQEVYDSIFTYIDQGIAILDADSDFPPGAADLIFGDSDDQMGDWLRFANTLKLRAYLRISLKDEGKATAGINALYATTPEFLEEDAQIEYTASGGNQNPLFSEILGLGRTQNLYASATSVDTLQKSNDPRRRVFYRNVTGFDTIVGIPQGSYDNTPSDDITDGLRSSASFRVGARGGDDNSALAPVKLISAAESYFLQAEVYTRGFRAGNAQTMFTEGIRASFASYDVAGVDEYIATSPSAAWPAGEDAQWQAIMFQKWVAMNGSQGFEAWTEWRRTGYPNLLQQSQASVLAAGLMPQRFLYPSTELTRNLNFPGQTLVEDKVWWDAN